MSSVSLSGLHIGRDQGKGKPEAEKARQQSYRASFFS
jgi:hypothetical protein